MKHNFICKSDIFAFSSCLYSKSAYSIVYFTVYPIFLNIRNNNTLHCMMLRRYKYMVNLHIYTTWCLDQTTFLWIMSSACYTMNTRNMWIENICLIKVFRFYEYMYAIPDNIEEKTHISKVFNFNIFHAA